MGAFLDPYALPDGSISPEHVAAEAAIAGQVPEYRRKMQQIAEEHPEFLQSLIEYGELKKNYEDAK